MEDEGLSFYRLKLYFCRFLALFKRKNSLYLTAGIPMCRLGTAAEVGAW